MDYYEKPYVTLSPNFTDNTIPFKQDGGTQQLTIETNRRFSITFGEGAEWVSACLLYTSERTVGTVTSVAPVTTSRSSARSSTDALRPL